ncbi:MAG TPA: hypothetical protein VIU64_03125 [Polyangia bacterium]
MRRLIGIRYNNGMHGAARLVVSLPIAIIAATLQVACAPADDRPAPKDAGGDADGGTGDSGPDASSDAGDGASGAPTYTKDVQPILKSKCGSCHGGQGLGNHNIATDYADVKKLMPDMAFDAPDDCWKDVDRMMPKTIGECAIVAIKLGWMPYQAMCSSAMPEDPSKCVSPNELAVLEKWVTAGMPE